MTLIYKLLVEISTPGHHVTTIIFVLSIISGVKILNLPADSVINSKIRKEIQ